MRPAFAVGLVWLASASVAGAQGTPRKVFHLDSYHKGYGISDETAEGLKSVFASAPVEFTTFYLDTKRHGSEAEIAEAVKKAQAAIEQFKPEVIIASDDAAVKYVIVPHFKNGPTPVVFCGVNWSADAYGLPTPTVTGMVEVVPVLEGLDLLRKYYPGAKKLGVLSEDSLSEHNNRTQLEPKYQAMGFEVTYVMVKDYAAWKREYGKLQQAVDVLYLPTQGAVVNWSEADAKAFVRASTLKPSLTTDAFMMGYTLIGITKTQVEQGEWAAHTALDVLNGRKPADIPVVRNRRRVTYLNPALAAKLKFVPGPELKGAKNVD
jgi:ABC-type uncharacterized transport system substrate-binding protein